MVQRERTFKYITRIKIIIFFTYYISTSINIFFFLQNVININYASLDRRLVFVCMIYVRLLKCHSNETNLTMGSPPRTGSNLFIRQVHNIIYL